ncbi:MAG: Minf_1886 family protein [Verrucomicrobiota bacterium]|nr:Minf_1886 family protein [Verrucomicrobiota bacterium]
MQALRFDSSVDNILEREKRFEAGAYFLLKDALDFTLKRTREEGGEERHVSGEELIHGFRDHALQEFGPMAFTLLREWGVHTCSDIGDMVFELIEEGMFGKQDSDTREDFADHYDFAEAFLLPYLPEGVSLESLQTGEPEDPETDGDLESPVSPAPQDAS